MWNCHFLWAMWAMVEKNALRKPLAIVFWGIQIPTNGLIKICLNPIRGISYLEVDPPELKKVGFLFSKRVRDLYQVYPTWWNWSFFIHQVSHKSANPYQNPPFSCVNPHFPMVSPWFLPIVSPAVAVSARAPFGFADRFNGRGTKAQLSQSPTDAPDVVRGRN